MHYPTHTVLTLLGTDMVTDATRQALTDRLNTPIRQPTFFSADEYDLLRSVCDRLIPQADRLQPIDIAGGIDERLTKNGSNGWRYDVMPSDGEAYKRGLQGIAESADQLFQQPFQQLSDQRKDTIIGLLKTAEAPGKTWESLPADRFFEELLSEAAENYYSHPLAQEEIGYVGMADVPTWQRVGLNELEDREPRPLND